MSAHKIERKSWSQDIGGGYRIVTKLFEYQGWNEEWIEYTLHKDGRQIAWCTKANLSGCKVSEVYLCGTQKEYEEYQRANIWRYPFDYSSLYDDCLVPLIQEIENQ